MLCIVKHKRVEFYLHSMIKQLLFGGVQYFIIDKLCLFSLIESSVLFRIKADII